MKVNFNQLVKNYKGEALTENGIEKSIKELVSSALFNLGEGFSKEEKMSAYMVMNRINSTEEVDLKAEEIVLVKKACENLFVAGVYGQIVELIEK